MRTWKIIYPDKTESIMNYDPILEEREIVKKEIKELKNKFKEMDKLASKYSKQIELMADGMSYDKAYKEVFEKERKVGGKRK